MNRKSVDQTQRDAAKQMLEKSLDGMISGAMMDHLGGGFHRYSVDRRWQIPHFEKMLYDNGQLASVYARAGQDFDREEYRRVAIGICSFVIRKLKANGGAFFSALNAIGATSGRSSRSTLMHTKLSSIAAAISASSNDSRSMTWHQWQAA